MAKDEQTLEIIEDLKDYYSNPEEYSMQAFEDIFQDRDPFEFLQERSEGAPSCYSTVIKIVMIQLAIAGNHMQNEGMKKVVRTENKPYIEAMREIRRSNKAGTHDNRPNRLRTRKNVIKAAIKEYA